jgi:hypothetical protein
MKKKYIDHLQTALQLLDSCTEMATGGIHLASIPSIKGETESSASSQFLGSFAGRSRSLTPIPIVVGCRVGISKYPRDPRRPRTVDCGVL